MGSVVSKYLSLLDSQRETAFVTLNRVTETQLWQKPVSKGRLLASTYRVVRWCWKLNGWYARLRRNRPYQTVIADLYRSPKFPHWVGFLWTPRYNKRKPVLLESLKAEIRTLHADIREFYEDKDEDVLGNLYLYDPWFRWCNLIVTLRIGIYHDQLHYDDIIKQDFEFKK